MKGNTFGIRALTLLIVGLMITSTIVLSAEKADDKTIKSLEIRTIENKYSKIPESLEISEKTKVSKIPENNYNTLGVDIPVMSFDGADALNPALTTDGGSNVLLAGEYYESAFNADVFFRYSKDSGNTWLPEGTVLSFDLASIGIVAEKPVIDHSGDLGAIGSFIDINLGGLPQFNFPDITNPEAGDQWGLITWTITEFLSSVDVAGWNSEFSPNPTWSNGLISMTGDISDTTNILYLLWSNSETGGTGIWTGAADADYEWYNLKVDNDLVTGMHWEAYEITSNAGEFEDSIEIDWIQLDGTDDWWQNNEWNGATIEGGSNPSIDAANGKAYCAFEFNGGISCAFSNNNGGTLDQIEISPTGSNPQVSIVGDSVLITYIENGNLISVVSEDSGMTWEESTINDESGTVIDGSHSSSCAGPYIAWSDERTGLSSIFFDKVAADVPIIEIDSISGGIGITVEVSNSGTAAGENIPYSISATGGILGMIAKEVEGTININPDSSATLSLPMIIGLGAVTIDVSVGSASETVEGTQLLIFTSL